MEVSLIVSFSLVLVVIISLDRPHGMMRLDTRPLVTVLNMLRSGG